MLLSITLQRYKLNLNLQNKIGIIFNFIYKKNPSRPWPMIVMGDGWEGMVATMSVSKSRYTAKGLWPNDAADL